MRESKVWLVSSTFGAFILPGFGIYLGILALSQSGFDNSKEYFKGEGGRMRTSTKELALYETWYNFKRELQGRSGLIVLNSLWQQVKPKAPLPWCEDHMKKALGQLSGRIMRLTICPRCGGNLVVDKDIDGYYKRCVQCSCNIPFQVPESLLPRPTVKKTSRSIFAARPLVLNRN
jgi:hypothetical protein